MCKALDFSSATPDEVAARPHRVSTMLVMVQEGVYDMQLPGSEPQPLDITLMKTIGGPIGINIFKFGRGFGFAEFHIFLNEHREVVAGHLVYTHAHDADEGVEMRLTLEEAQAIDAVAKTLPMNKY